MRHLPRHAVALLFAFSLSAPFTSTFADGPADDARAMELVKQGNAAFRKGDWNAAESAYKQAWSVKRGFDIAGNLGEAEIRLGQFKEAAEHLAFSVTNFPVSGDPGLKARMEKSLATAKAEVGAVAIVVSIAGSAVRIDGKDIGASPLAADVFVDPGPHRIEATHEGYSLGSKEVQSAKGARETVTITLVPTAAPPSPTPARSAVPAVVLGGLAVVGVGLGIGMLVASGGKSSTATDLSTAIKQDHRSCVAGAANFDARCADLDSATSGSDTFHNIAIGSFVGAGAAAVGAAVYMLWPRSTAEPAKNGIRVAPQIVGPTRGLDLAVVF